MEATFCFYSIATIVMLESLVIGIDNDDDDDDDDDDEGGG